MPEADQFEWPVDTPLFNTDWRAITEGLIGNGVVGAGDFEVTATANTRETQVAAGTAFYGASETSLGSATTQVHSVGDGTHDRWDILVWDTATSSVTLREGTAAATPEPPDLQGDEILLALVKVPQNFDTAFSDADHIFNRRVYFSNEAEEVHYNDDTGTYSVDNVDAALDELQEAAQIGSYPLGLDEDTDMDVDSTDLTDGATVLYESANGFFRNEVVQALANLTGDEQLSAYPLVIGTDVANHLAGGDLLASSGGNTVYDSTDDHVPRPRVDTHQSVTTVTTATYTTSDEEVVLVDLGTIGAATTITLASADAVQGNSIVVADLTGDAGTHTITVDTEGSETIAGATSKDITTDGSALTFVSDGTNWTLGAGSVGGGVATQDDGASVLAPANAINFKKGLNASDDGSGVAGVDYEHAEVFEGRESGTVTAGNQGVLTVDALADGETVEVYKAALTLADGTAVGSSTTLELVTLDNSGGFTSRTTLITGDGATVFDDQTGSPLGSYTNSSGGEQTIAVLVNNQESSDIDIIAVSEGVTAA